MKKVWLGIVGLILIPYLIYAATVDIQGVNNNQEFNTMVIANDLETVGAASNTYALPSAMSRFTWTTQYSGAATSSTVLLQGSLDNSNWYTIDTSTTAEMRHVTNKPVKYLRAYLSDKQLTATHNGATASVIGMKN